MVPNGNYRHQCQDSRLWDEETIGCDHTTLQQAFPKPLVTVDNDAISRSALFQQCKAVLMSYTPDAKQVKAYAHNHPFLWPQKPSSSSTADEQDRRLIIDAQHRRLLDQQDKCEMRSNWCATGNCDCLLGNCKGTVNVLPGKCEELSKVLQGLNCDTGKNVAGKYLLKTQCTNSKELSNTIQDVDGKCWKEEEGTDFSANKQVTQIQVTVDASGDLVSEPFTMKCGSDCYSYGSDKLVCGGTPIPTTSSPPNQSTVAPPDHTTGAPPQTTGVVTVQTSGAPMTETGAPAPPFIAPPGYETCQVLDFEIASDETKLAKGAYVTDQFVEKWGVSITADTDNRDSGYTPDGAARIFDSSNPGTDNENGDPDLGTPNKGCDKPGPGVGAAGRPGSDGENCVPLGNLLIIQESDKEYPDDNAKGGSIAFDFVRPTYVDFIGLVDIEDNHDFIEVLTVDGAKFNVHARALGNNSVQRLQIKSAGVIRLMLHMQGSGAVSDLGLCHKSDEDVNQPVPAYVAPLVGIAAPLRSRLEQVSLNWSNATMAPPNEENAGVIIYIDPTSFGIDKALYTRFIRSDLPITPTSITIMTSPTCMTVNLPTGEPCKDYVNDVYQQIKTDFSISNTGFDGEEGIKHEIVCSTAGAASRMMRSRMLMCPPNTPSCLMPAMGKYSHTSALLFETATQKKPTEFFTLVGYNGRVKVAQIAGLTSPDSFKVGPAPPANPTTSGGAPAAPIYLTMSEPVDPNGYLASGPTPPFTALSLAISKTPLEVWELIAPTIKSSKTIPNDDPYASHDRPERVPVPSAIMKALQTGTPLDWNYLTPTEELQGGAPQLVSEQLGSVESIGMATRPLSDMVFASQAQARQDSIERIKELHEGNSETVHPPMEIEVWCPEGQEPETTGGGDRRLRQLQKMQISAKDFKFLPDMRHLCREAKVPESDFRFSHAERRAMKRRRQAAIAHATKKQSKRPQQISHRQEVLTD